MGIRRRWLVLAALVVGTATPAQAQSRAYVGGTAAIVTSPQGATFDRASGTTWSGSLVVGVAVSRRLSLEFEPTLVGEVSAKDYSYRPHIDRTAAVDGTARDRFFSVQLRGRAGVLEPVAGVSYVRSRMHRHAIFTPGGQLYFDNEVSDDGIAFTGGLDAACALSPHVSLTPTLRLFVVSRPGSPAPAHPVIGGTVVVRAGLGVRVDL